MPTACPDCGGSVEVTHVASQYQEEIPEVRPIVRRFDIEVGRCSQCRRRVQGRHALQTSDALGAAGVQLGPGVVALVVELHTEMGVPLAKVAHVLRTTFGLQVTPGGLAHLLHRTARDAAPTYTALCEQVRNSPVVTPDETGWRVGAISHWLWAFVTPEMTVYAICPGRGFDDATTVLGADFDGVLVRDGWVSYRCYRAALHQSCLNHLLRRCKELQEDHPDSLWAGQVQAVLQTGLAVRDRCNDGELSEHGLASVRGRLVARLGRLIDAPPPLDDAARFARHLATEFAAVFLFLWDLSVDATNWRAEQAIPPAVVIRKVCGGNRTRHGADTQQGSSASTRPASPPSSKPCSGRSPSTSADSTPTTVRSSSTTKSPPGCKPSTSTSSPSPDPAAATTTPSSRARTARSSASTSDTATSPAVTLNASTPSPSRSSPPT